MRDKFRDMLDAVELVENLERPATEEEQKAHDDALRSVQKWRAGRANGSDKMKDMNAAVKLVENCKEAGIVPTAKELKAHAERVRGSRLSRSRSAPLSKAAGRSADSRAGGER